MSTNSVYSMEAWKHVHVASASQNLPAPVSEEVSEKDAEKSREAA